MIWTWKRVITGATILTASSSATEAKVDPGVVAAYPSPVNRAALAPNFSGTSAVQISAQRFETDWKRARQDATGVPAIRRLVAPAGGLARDQQLGFVQSAVTQLIHWRSDTTLWGKHDYWASAAETLERGFGDSEDRAIVKMQALRALGFAKSDLYLTLARDTVAGPIKVLVVRSGGNYYILDDRGAPPFTPDRRPELHPVLSFGYDAIWVHTEQKPIVAGTTAASRVGLSTRR